MKRPALRLSPLFALLLLSALAAPARSAAPVAGGREFRQLPALVYRSNGVYSLLEAAAAGDVATLKARLAEGENPSQVDEVGNTPLHYAAQGKSARALKLLLEAGADPVARDASGRTPRELCRQSAFIRSLKQAEEKRERELELVASVSRGDEAAVRAALARGVSPNAVSADNERTALQQAVAQGHSAVVRMLISAGAEVNAVAGQNRATPLHLAAARGDAAIVHLLLEAHADPMRQSGNGAYPLHDAVWFHRLEAVRALLPAYAGSNFNPSGGPCGSPFAMAISSGREDCARAFLEAGLDLDKAGAKGEPLLILAVRSGHESCVKLLLNAGADKQARDAAGKTAADYASVSLAPLLR